MKKMYVGLFATTLLMTALPIVSGAEEVDTTATSETVSTVLDESDNNDVKPNLGKVTITAEGQNLEGVENDWSFTVPKPAELNGLKPGELTICGYQYDEQNPNLIGYCNLTFYRDNAEVYEDARMYYSVYDEGDNLRFAFNYGNINNNIIDGNKLTPYIGGEMDEGAPFFCTPDGTYSAFVRLIFTNVPQPGENNGEEENTNQGGDTNQEENTNQDENNNQEGNTDQQNEKEFVDKVKEKGDTSEKYADNEKLPQTSQSSTVFKGMMVLMLSIATVAFAKFKFL